MLFVKFQEFFLLMISIIHFYGQTVNTECLTPDHIRGSCVPLAKCRRIEWMLDNWSPPYPVHIVEFIRKSHCGTQGDIHYACCAYYDIKDQKPQVTSSTTSPSAFAHNPHHPFHSGQIQYQPNFGNTPNPCQYHRPTDNYVQQPLGERILRSMPCGPLNGDRISNGEIVRMSEFPWMVLLESGGIESRERFRCAGTLITNQYVLTAAHCAEAKNDVISIRLGEHDLKSEHDCEHYKKPHVVSHCAPPYEDIPVESISLHPDFKTNTLQSDIALIRLVRPVEFQSNIKPICLPLHHIIADGIPTDQIVAGWGITEKGHASDILLKATLPVQPLAVCQNIYRQSGTLAPESLCAGGVDQRGTCRADSGGPLFTAVPYEHRHHSRYVQFGITSAGSYGCGSKHNLPGIYTNVRSFMPWIIGNIY